MIVIQIQELDHSPENQFRFCIQTFSGFTWITKDKIKFNPKVSIIEYAKDSKSKIIGDFNEG
jgi:hypothetical protein